MLFADWQWSLVCRAPRLKLLVLRNIPVSYRGLQISHDPQSARKSEAKLKLATLIVITAVMHNCSISCTKFVIAREYWLQECVLDGAWLHWGKEHACRIWICIDIWSSLLDMLADTCWSWSASSPNNRAYCMQRQTFIEQSPMSCIPVNPMKL